MKKLDLLPGTLISRASAMLVEQAPAHATFNGIAIRARYATTHPRDVEAHYHRLSELRSIQWRASPAGRTYAERDAREIREAQEKLDALMVLLMKLSATELADTGATLAWITHAVALLDRVGVVSDKPAIVLAFEAAGWVANACCGDAFDGEDEGTFARYIVGQFLNGLNHGAANPEIMQLISDWRAKFRDSTTT